MKLKHRHSWRLPCPEARELQATLASRVVQKPLDSPIATVAGVDVAVRKGIARAAVVVLKFPSLEVKDAAVAERKIEFPYIPGLLSFREGPSILDALEKLTAMPDLIIFDGQGVAHPRRLGIASHIGVLLDRPTIGCAKSRLCGTHEEPGGERGSHAPLVHNGTIIGAVLRTRTEVKPVFVSAGHRIDLTGSIRYVLGCCSRYRLPETTRLAHRLSTINEGKAHGII